MRGDSVGRVRIILSKNTLTHAQNSAGQGGHHNTNLINHFTHQSLTMPIAPNGHPTHIDSQPSPAHEHVSHPAIAPPQTNRPSLPLSLRVPSTSWALQLSRRPSEKPGGGQARHQFPHPSDLHRSARRRRRQRRSTLQMGRRRQRPPTLRPAVVYGAIRRRSVRPRAVSEIAAPVSTTPPPDP